MADWKFTDDYLAQYPALAGSILSLLSFADHSLDGTTFTGTLDVSATPALLTLGQIAGVTAVPVTGTVTNANNTLTVSLTSTAASGLVDGLKGVLPLIGPVLTDATIAIDVVTLTTDDPEDSPAINAFNVAVTFTVGSSKVTIAAQVPMADGFMVLTGTFTGVSVNLTDLDFLIKGGGGGDNWFPTAELGPYAAGTPSLELISTTLMLYVVLAPSVSIRVSSVTVEIGITNIALLDQRLYLNPLAVVITVPSTNPAMPATVGLVGELALCSYTNPGHPDTPDAVLEVQMGLTDFTLSAQLETPTGTTGILVKTLVSDLMGADTDIGLPDTLTVDKFDFFAQADKATGTISAFATELAMSGGFGLFNDFDVEGFDLSLEYSA